MVPVFFSPGDSHTKGLLVLLHLGLEGITEVNTDSKGRFVSFKVTLSNDRVLCVYAPSGDSAREQLARGHFFEGLQNCVENRNKGNENKMILGGFNCTMDKMQRLVEIKHRLYRCCFNYPLPKLIVDNGLDDLWRRENPDSSEFTHCDRSSGARYRIDRIYADMKIANNTKINHIMVSFTDHYHAIFIDRFSSETKTGKDSWYCNNSLLCKLEFSSTTNIFFIKNTKNNHSSASDWWENTKSNFKDVRAFSENSRKC